MKILKRVALVILILLVVCYLLVSWMLSNRVLFPESSLEKTKGHIVKYWNSTYEDELAKLPAFKDIEVETQDGWKLNVKYFTKSDSSSCAIIFAHGWGAIWADMMKYTPLFSDCNCDYVFYDHRAHGNSGGKYATGGLRESQDLWQITKWVSETYNYPYNQIGWMGSSWGGGAAIIAGAEEANVGFIIVDSPYQDWSSAVFERAIVDYGSGIMLLAHGVMETVNLRAGVNYREASPMEKIGDAKEPILIVHSKADSETNSQQSVNIAQKGNRKTVEFYHTKWGNDHIMDVINNTEDFQRIVKGFLKKRAPNFLR